MKAFAIVFLLFLAATSSRCFAQSGEQYSACNAKAKTQAEMNACASQEAAHADAELNEVYRKLIAEASRQPEAVERIRTAERAWTVYRDAYINAMYPAKDKQTEYGSVYPMQADLLRASLTRRQVDALKELLRQYEQGTGTK